MTKSQQVESYIPLRSLISVLARLFGHLLIIATAMFAMSACGQTVDHSVSHNRGIVLELSVVGDALLSGKVVLRSSVTNNREQAVKFLPWNTPFEVPISGDFLSVVDKATGQILAYQGMMIKRLPPVEDDFVILPAGGTLVKELDISTGFDFCAGSLYSIVFSGALYNQSSKLLEIDKNNIEVRLGNSFAEC